MNDFTILLLNIGALIALAWLFLCVIKETRYYE